MNIHEMFTGRGCVTIDNRLHVGDDADRDTDTGILPAGLREAQAAGIKFTDRPKIRFFAPQGRLVESIHVELDEVHGQMGPLGCAKFHLNRFRGWKSGPKI